MTKTLSLISKKKVSIYQILGMLGETESLALLKQIAEGFKNLTENKIVHRDVKPSNIFVTKGVLKIADFGFCEFVE